jgi:hypothetical protein
MPTTREPVFRVLLTRLRDQSTSTLTFRKEAAAQDYVDMSKRFKGGTVYDAEYWQLPDVGDDVFMIEFGQPYLSGTVTEVGERAYTVDLSGEPHGGEGFDFWPINSCRRVEDVS